MEKLVSIIMSTYNEEPNWIKESINSILNQTYRNFEFIIILDNPKNVELRELLIKYQINDNRIKIVQNENNKGLVKSLNIALEHCNGEYIARMDADDVSNIDRIRKEKEYLEVKNLDFVFSGMIMINQNGKRIYELDDKELNYVEVKRQLGVSNISNHPTWFVRKEVYKKLEGYREIPYCEDYDFSLRALNHGYKIGKIEGNLLMYRIRDNSITRSNNFQQSLISLKLIQLYKMKKLEDYYYVTKLIGNLKDRLNNIEREKYINAENKFLQGSKLIKKGQYIKGTFEILGSIFISKYYIMKTLDTFKCKILIR